jgi:hypothetical protein
MTEHHLSDDRLIELCVSATPVAAERDHLAACAACESKRASIVQILSELDEAATVEAEAAFPPDRLERQQARIAHRIEQDGRPGRVIHFPAQQPSPMLMFRSKSQARWAAAAAAAAFIMGLLAGHLAHDLPLRDERPPQILAIDANPAPLRPVSTTFSEDEFLGQVELATTRNGPVALRPLDAMTPRAWDVR